MESLVKITDNFIYILKMQPYFKKPVNIAISVEAAEVIGLNKFDRDNVTSYKNLKPDLLNDNIEFSSYFLPEDFDLKEKYLLTKKDELFPRFKYNSFSREILPGMNPNLADVLTVEKNENWYNHYLDDF
jgi:hypothetical protein